MCQELNKTGLPLQMGVVPRWEDGRIALDKNNNITHGLSLAPLNRFAKAMRNGNVA